MIDKQKQGRINRAAGARFELVTRHDLEKRAWIVIKNPNNVIGNQFKQGKSKYNPFTKRLMMNSGGFTDFIAWKQGDVADIEIEAPEFNTEISSCYGIIAIECKTNGYLDKEEKEKCRWLLNHKVFSKILIAKKTKQGRKIVPEYIDFVEKYEK